MLVQGIAEIVLMLSEPESGDGQPQCLFTGPPTGPVHPFVTLIIKRSDLTPTVLEEVANILRHPDQKYDIWACF